MLENKINQKNKRFRDRFFFFQNVDIFSFILDYRLLFFFNEIQLTKQSLLFNERFFLNLFSIFYVTFSIVFNARYSKMSNRTFYSNEYISHIFQNYYQFNKKFQSKNNCDKNASRLCQNRLFTKKICDE